MTYTAVYFHMVRGQLNNFKIKTAKYIWSQITKEKPSNYV